jgi:short-subunit dehydrogenase
MTQTIATTGAGGDSGPAAARRLSVNSSNVLVARPGGETETVAKELGANHRRHSHG